MKSTGPDPLLDAWENTLKASGSRGAIFDTRGNTLRTFLDVEEESGALDRELERIVRPGEVVAVQTGNHPSWPALLLAGLRRDLIILPLERSMTNRERDAALQVCQAAAVVEAGAPSNTPAEAIVFRPLPHDPIEWGPSQPVLLKLTSGTTAAPRAIRFRSEQLLADCTQICETMKIDSRDLNFAVIPVSHSYGFSNLITPLIAQGVPMVLSRDRIPRAVLEDIARSGATVFPGTPVFYQAFSEIQDLPHLSRLRLCISAGAPLPLETARKFRASFQQSIHSFYGASECGGICYDHDALLIEQGFVGQPVNGVFLEMLDPNAAATHVRVRTAAAGDGYFPEPTEEKLGDGRFVPDDLLAAGDGGFCIVGRTSDVINVAGKKVSPAEVEAELLRFHGVNAAVVFGRESKQRNEEVAACVVAEAFVQEAELLEYCRRRLSGWQVPKRIFFLNEIPTNERGKVNRRALAERFSTS